MSPPPPGRSHRRERNDAPQTQMNTDAGSRYGSHGPATEAAGNLVLLSQGLCQMMLAKEWVRFAKPAVLAAQSAQARPTQSDPAQPRPNGTASQPLPQSTQRTERRTSDTDEHRQRLPAAGLHNSIRSRDGPCPIWALVGAVHGAESRADRCRRGGARCRGVRNCSGFWPALSCAASMEPLQYASRPARSLMSRRKHGGCDNIGICLTRLAGSVVRPVGGIGASPGKR